MQSGLVAAMRRGAFVGATAACLSLLTPFLRDVHAQVYNGFYFYHSEDTLSMALDRVYVGYGTSNPGATGWVQFADSSITSRDVDVGRSDAYTYQANSGNGGFYQGTYPSAGTLALYQTDWNTAGGANLLGRTYGDSGTEAIEGNSTLTTGWTNVGESGQGRINVNTGSRFVTGANGGTVQGAGLTIGTYSSGSGDVTIYGESSSMEVHGDAIVGLNGSGSLQVRNGATTSIEGTNWIGSSNTSNNAGGMPERINGALYVQVGSSLSANSNVLGYASNGSGGTTVSYGASLTAATSNTIGEFGLGYLDVAYGGHVTGATTNVAARAGSSGAVNINGAGSRLSTTDLYIGGSSAGAGGSAVVTLDGGGELVANGITQMYARGTLNIHNGTFVNNGTFGNSGGEIFVGPQGVLAGSGQFNQKVTIADGATIAPGNSPGTLTFVGHQTWGPGGQLNLEILDPAGVAGTGWDQVVVDGTLTLSASASNPFVINLSSLADPTTPGLLAGFDPLRDDRWQFLTADEILGFDPSAFVVNTAGFFNSLAGGWFGVSEGGSGLYLDFHAAPTDVGTVTPEPTSLALASLAGLGLAFRSWQGRRQNSAQAS